MKFVKQFENKKVLVLGLAKSGESAARLLDRLGAIVTVNDGKDVYKRQVSGRGDKDVAAIADYLEAKATK